MWFLPYLSGERPPLNNPGVTGAFWGLTHQHGPADIARAAVEGISFGLADGMDVLHATGLRPASVTVIGGGAARLALIGQHAGEPLENMLPSLPLEASYTPDAAHHQTYQAKRRLFAELYRQLAALRP